MARAALSLTLAVLGSCNVYDTTLLGTPQSGPGGGGAIAPSGTAGMSVGSSAGMGDHEFAGGPAGSSGMGGLGGNVGEAGVLDPGAAGEGGTAEGGVAGATGGGGAAAGTGGAPQLASGCAKLVIPLDAGTDKAHFVITLSAAIDLSAGMISTRLYVLAGSGGAIFNYVQDSATYHFLGVPTAQRSMLRSSADWSALTWNVGTEPDAGTNIVKTSIKNIGIEVNAAPSTVWANPTVIYIDSITLSTPTVTSTFTFDAPGSVYPTPTSTNVSGQALWINGGSTDTTATGTTLTWQASCP